MSNSLIDLTGNVHAIEKATLQPARAHLITIDSLHWQFGVFI